MKPTYFRRSILFAALFIGVMFIGISVYLSRSGSIFIAPYRDSEERLSIVLEQGNQVWAQAVDRRQLQGILLIDRSTREVVRYDVAHLNIIIPEFAIHPGTNRIVYSTFIRALELEEDPPIQNASLHVYNLLTEQDEILMTEDRTSPFDPRWLNEETIEYHTESGNTEQITL